MMKDKFFGKKNRFLTFVKSYFLFGLFFWGISSLYGQHNTQTVRGVIIDIDTRTPLMGASVELLPDSLGYTSTSDDQGFYKVVNVPVGRYQMRIRYLGYKTTVLSEILVESGRETVIDVALKETSTSLNQVEVSALRMRPTIPLSMHTLTVEEVRRFPATFNDPARLTTSVAGVINDNDQANGMIIRGNSPNLMTWRLAGAEIVNPNHLSNAGTFYDRPTANGGGVNILSAQMLDASHLMKGAYPVGYGNALSGIMDMHLRKGNNEQAEYTLSLGLIGLDAAIEGPFSKNKKASYLANYRYSTIGFLDALGVALGEEAISFQDFSYHLNLPLKRGTLQFFGLGGLSKNTFEAERDTSLWEFEKDNQDIVFKNKMGALGGCLEYPFRKKWLWQSTLVHSALETTRQSDLLSSSLQLQKSYEKDELTQSKTALHTYLLYKKNTRHQFKMGINGIFQQFGQQSVIRFSETVADAQINGILWQPYVQWETQAGKWTSLVGIQYSYFGTNGSRTIEPRASIKWTFDKNKYLGLSYGLHSQTQRPAVYASAEYNNQNLDFTKAHHFVLGYHAFWKNTHHFSVEAYYQDLFDVPIVNEVDRTYSVLNVLDGWVNEPLANAGSGTNYGLEISLRRFAKNGFYYLTNATWYRSLYTGGDGVLRSTRYDGQYLANATIGKEWSKRKKGSDRTWGVSGRLVYSGGFRDTPIDSESSLAIGTTIYNESQAFTLQQADYFKLDLRFYHRKDKEKLSRTIAFDLQNATNQTNIAFSYFDRQKGTVVTRNQLGLIPNLNYRIQF